MKFSYNWLQSFFSKQLPKPQKLAELLTMKSFEVESVEKYKNDWILHIDILPNRAHDCLSYTGLAREIAALTNYEIRNGRGQPLARKGEAESDSAKRSDGRTVPASRKGGLLDVKIQDKSLVPRYTALVIKGVEIKESPKWMQERLASMEQKPINNVVDLTNYVMWELGQPLHAFDFDKINGAKMTIRESKRGEELETLDGDKHSLDAGTIIIEDSGLPSEALARGGRLIDLAGIKGGASTQIDNSTKTIVLQAAIFDPAHIRKTIQNIGFRTDAAVRYMHGFDSQLPPQALQRALELLRETNPGAEIVQKIEIYPNPAKSKKISLDLDYANRLLGTNLPEGEVQQILKQLDFKFQVSGFKFQVSVPTHRLDINIPEDLIEEIGRIYGYEKIKSEMPSAVLIVPRRNENIFWRGFARQLFSGMGFSEVYNYSLVPSNSQQIIAGRDIELENPVSDKFRYLRKFLFAGLLQNISFNAKYTESVKLFEFGRVFNRLDGRIAEKENCVLATYSAKEDPWNFYGLKGRIDEFFNKSGITEFYYDPAFSKEEEGTHTFLHPGRRANIVLDNEKIGFLGEVHPLTCKMYGVKGRIYVAEFDFQKFREVAEEEHMYHTPSKYPEIVRDISLLVPGSTMVFEVSNAINSISGPLLRDIDLFDMYEGENMEGTKSFAFHLIFQSGERTLTSQEIDKIMSKITKILKDRGWEVR